MASMDGAAAAIPLSVGSTVIIYGQIAPDWLAQGIFATCFGLMLIHLLTAQALRPVMFSARFFEAASVAVMVQQMATRMPAWGIENTSATRVAVLCLLATLAGLVVAALWACRAQRFSRFIPSPVYAGFANAITVALIWSQSKALLEQTGGYPLAWVLVAMACTVFATAWTVRRWRPNWPAGALGLTMGAVLAALAAFAGQPQLPMLMQTAVYTPPVGLANFAFLWSPAVDHAGLWLALVPNALVLGTLVFLNTVVAGQMLTQKDDRHGVSVADKALQCLGLCSGGLLGGAPLSGSITAGMAATRREPLSPSVLYGMALCVAAVYLSNALLLIPLVALVGMFWFDAWLLWDRPSSRDALKWWRERTLPAHAKEDLIVIAGVMAASLGVNLVAGLVVGLVLGLLLHAHRNTRQPVRQWLNGTQIASVCARSRAELSLLAEHGKEIALAELENNQYFASASQLGASVRRQLVSPVRVLIMDWTSVLNTDSSVGQVVARVHDLAANQRIRVIHALGGPAESTVREVLLQHVPHAELCPDTDHAMEAAENHLIHIHSTEALTHFEADEVPLLMGLDEAQRQIVMQRVAIHDFSPGTPLVERGAPSDGLWLILRGQATVQVRTVDGRMVRLAGSGPGTTVGEMGFLDGAPRSATVRAATQVEAAHLSHAAFEEIATRHPAVAQRLLTNMAIDMATRLRATNSRSLVRQLAR